jgi:hypothetical protein
VKALLALLLFTPFYVVNQLHFPFEFTIKGLNVFNVLFFSILFILMAKGIKSDSPAPLKGPFYFLLFMLAWGFIVGVADDPSAWVADLTEFKTAIFYILLYFLYFRAVQDEKTLRYVFIAVMFTAFVASLEAVREGIDYGFGVYNETRRASGPFGVNYWAANRAAAYYVIFVPIFLALYVSFRSRPMIRLLCLFCIFVGVMGDFVTYSRQSYFIMSALFLFVTLRKNKLVAVAILIALANYEAWAPDAVIERIQMTDQSNVDKPAAPSGTSASGGGEQRYDQSTESRMIIWEGAWRMMQDYPLGVGLNHFKRHIGDYVPEYAGYDAHNVYVRTAAEASLLGPISMIVLLAATYFLGRRLEKGNFNEEANGLGLGLQLASVGMLMSNIYGSRFFDGDVVGNFWVLAALAARSLVLNERAAKAAAAANLLAVHKAAPGLGVAAAATNVKTAKAAGAAAQQLSAGEPSGQGRVAKPR